MHIRPLSTSSKASMRVILIRHGEAFHNVKHNGVENHDLPDPFLTPLGQSQASSIPQRYPSFISSLSAANSVIICSPFRRTIETSLLAFSTLFPPLSATPIPFIIHPALQEINDGPCDTGADLEETKAHFPQWLDWINCTEGWNSNKGFYEATPEVQLARGTFIRKLIKRRTEEVVVIIGHAGFLRAILKIPKGKLWENAEAKEFKFVTPLDVDDEADLVRVEDNPM